jgi:hypothetical protein
VNDKIDNSLVYLAIESDTLDGIEIKTKLRKIDTIYRASLVERQYFEKVFQQKYDKELFTSDSGNYKLYYPITIKGRVYILKFDDTQHYGKFGS